MANPVTVNSDGSTTVDTSWAVGTGTTQEAAKAKSKSERQLAQLQGTIQKRLAAQNAQYQIALAAQNNAASMEQLRAKQGFDSPFQAANLTGNYNGSPTLASQQLSQQGSQFQQTFGLDKEKLAQSNDQFGRKMTLEELQNSQSVDQFGRKMSLEERQAQNQQDQFGKTFGLQTEQEANRNRQFGENLGFQREQLGQSGQQFQQTHALQQQQFALQTEIDTRKQALSELSEQHSNAIAQGNLDLARQIQTKAQELQAQQQAAQQKIEIARTSGVMENGNFTEAARGTRSNEALQRAQAMGYYQASYADVVPTGQVGGFGYNDERSYHEANRLAEQAGTAPKHQMTDAAQQWRTNSGLQAAQIAAQMSSNPQDYFTAAAFLRDPNSQQALGFLQDINRNGVGSNAGFRAAGTATPPTQTLGSVAQGMPGFMTAPVTGQGAVAPDGPSGSITQAAAIRDGTTQPYGSQMYKEPLAPNISPSAQAAQNQAYSAPAFMNPTGDVAAQRLAAFQPIFQAGAHKMAAGSLEAMSPTERGLFNGAAKASGINPDDWEKQYKLSHTFNNESAMRA